MGTMLIVQRADTENSAGDVRKIEQAEPFGFSDREGIALGHATAVHRYDHGIRSGLQRDRAIATAYVVFSRKRLVKARGIPEIETIAHFAAYSVDCHHGTPRIAFIAFVEQDAPRNA